MERKSLQTDEEIKEFVHNLILQDIYKAAFQGLISREEFEHQLDLEFGGKRGRRGDMNGDK